jgi:hypothetical protein
MQMYYYVMIDQVALVVIFPYTKYRSLYYFKSIYFTALVS